MLFWIALVCIIVMLAAAVAVLLSPNLLSAVIAFAIVSLALSIMFVVLQAPDVALAEAVIGVGLSSILFALTLHRIGLQKSEMDEK
jgi:uncharacterized MnhB-related membrane protein